MTRPALPRQPFREHVAELRWRFFIVVLVFLAGSGLGFAIKDQILALLVAPLHQQLYYSSPIGGLNFVFEVCNLVGLVFAIPVVVFQIIGFVRPVLPLKSSWSYLRYVLASTLMMVVGIGFAYLICLPPALHFFNSFSVGPIKALISASEYFHFILIYLIGFALIFQLPVLILLINSFFPLRPRQLGKQLKWVILASIIIAMVANPAPDVIAQALLALPITGLYILSIYLVWRINQGRRNQPLALAQAEIIKTELTVRDGKEGFLCWWEDSSRQPANYVQTFLYRGKHTLVGQPGPYRPS
jgi:sec-independent protein translocase protein TatC